MKKLNWLTKQFEEFCGDIILNFINSFQDGVVKIFESGTSFSEQAEVVSAIKAATMIALALVVVMVAKAILSTYVFETDGDPDGDPMQLLVKAAQAICLICCNDIIFNTMTKISSLLAKDMNASVTPKKIFVSIENYINYIFNTLQGGVLVIIIVLIVYLVFVVMLAIKAGIRGVELALMKILWPFFAVDIITVSAERWNAFFTSYAVTFFGYIIQLFCFNMSIVTFAKSLTEKNMSYDCLLAFGWMYFALNAPKWLEKYAYSSGASRTARSGIGGIAQLATALRHAK